MNFGSSCFDPCINFYCFLPVVAGQDELWQELCCAIKRRGQFPEPASGLRWQAFDRNIQHNCSPLRPFNKLLTDHLPLPPLWRRKWPDFRPECALSIVGSVLIFS
jgi:hypothetical protein